MTRRIRKGRLETGKRGERNGKGMDDWFRGWVGESGGMEWNEREANTKMRRRGGSLNGEKEKWLKERSDGKNDSLITLPETANKNPGSMLVQSTAALSQVRKYKHNHKHSSFWMWDTSKSFFSSVYDSQILVHTPLLTRGLLSCCLATFKQLKSRGACSLTGFDFGGKRSQFFSWFTIDSTENLDPNLDSFPTKLYFNVEFSGAGFQKSALLKWTVFLKGTSQLFWKCLICCITYCLPLCSTVPWRIRQRNSGMI